MKQNIGIDRFAKQLRYASSFFMPCSTLYSSTAIAPVTNAVVVEMAGMIFPAIFLIVLRSAVVIP